MQAVRQRIEAAGAPEVAGIIQAAMTYPSARLCEVFPYDVHDELKAKVLGSWVVYDAFGSADLDFFVFLSSVAGTFPELSVGSGLYGAGCAFQDAFATHLAARGVSALSISWGAWSGLGYVASEKGSRIVDYAHALGFVAFELGEGLDALGRLLGGRSGHVVCVPLDRKRLRGAHRAPALLARLLADDAELGEDSEDAERDEALCRRIREAANPQARRAGFVEYVSRQCAELLELRSRPVADRSLTHYGMDSLMMFQLQRRLAGDFGDTLALRKLMEAGSIAAIAELLARSSGAAAEDEGARRA